MGMNVSVISDITSAPAALSDLAQTAVTATLSAVLGRCELQIAVLFATPEHMRELNARFGDEDKVTDVLAFNQQENWLNGELQPNSLKDIDNVPHTAAKNLGDIAICLAQAAKQAGENGVSTEHELAKLAVHGTLHLLGYDHHTPADEARMFGLTDQILQTIFEQ